MEKLYKSPATDKRFQSTRKKYENSLNDFLAYAERLTIEAGRVKKGSNKAGSYRNYLVRFIILYEDNFMDSINDLNSFETLSKFRKVVELPGFKDFNKKTGRFFNATYSCFTSYLSYTHSFIEAQSDEMLTNKLEELSIATDDLSKKISPGPKSRALKNIKTNKGYAYPRNPYESLAAKIASGWVCEIDSKHITFISSLDDKPFVEAHHLIPMSVQDDFKNTLDFADNIVSLCPNCHRLVHHSELSTRKNAIIKLFETRKNLYENHGIKIDQKTLLTYYGIVNA